VESGPEIMMRLIIIMEHEREMGSLREGKVKRKDTEW
jgi:hypothetical protein